MIAQDVTQALGGRWFGHYVVAFCASYANKGYQDKARTACETDTTENDRLKKENAAISAKVNGVKATQEVSQLRSEYCQSRTVNTTFYLCKATNSVERLCGGVAV